jgi:hypothetical protein
MFETWEFVEEEDGTLTYRPKNVKKESNIESKDKSKDESKIDPPANILLGKTVNEPVANIDKEKKVNEPVESPTNIRVNKMLANIGVVESPASIDKEKKVNEPVASIEKEKKVNEPVASIGIMKSIEKSSNSIGIMELPVTSPYDAVITNFSNYTIDISDFNIPIKIMGCCEISKLKIVDFPAAINAIQNDGCIEYLIKQDANFNDLLAFISTNDADIDIDLFNKLLEIKTDYKPENLVDLFIKINKKIFGIELCLTLKKEYEYFNNLIAKLLRCAKNSKKMQEYVYYIAKFDLDYMMEEISDPVWQNFTILLENNLFIKLGFKTFKRYCAGTIITPELFLPMMFSALDKKIDDKYSEILKNKVAIHIKSHMFERYETKLWYDYKFNDEIYGYTYDEIICECKKRYGNERFF